VWVAGTVAVPPSFVKTLAGALSQESFAADGQKPMTKAQK
jgi:hypothetical protein